MKRYISLAILGVAALSLTGCATPYPVGSLYTGVNLPVTATANSGAASKMGSAECKSYFSLVALGDASIEAAKRNGGITKVHHVDWEAKNILGFIGTYRVTVYGE